MTSLNNNVGINPADKAGLSGVVTLQGAVSLTASAIALGVASLAF